MSLDCTGVAQLNELGVTIVNPETVGFSAD
jgi:hypothetical protein